MITGPPDSSIDKMQNQEGYSYLPPSGPPPSYAHGHTAYPSSADASAGSSRYVETGSSSQYQSQWQGSPTSPAHSGPSPSGYHPYPGQTSQYQPQGQGSPAPSPSAHHPYPPPSEIYPPAPSTNAERSFGPTSFDRNRDPLNPPPPSFARPAPPRQPSPPFPPLTLYSKAPSLDKGFPVALPAPSDRFATVANPYQQQQDPSQVFTHPFFERDVGEADWRRLIEDMYIVAQLSGTQKIAANVVPVAAGSGLVGGIFLTRAIERRMKKKKNEPVADLVDTWNQYFFHPRGLHVILAHGAENISGEIDGPAPDWVRSRRDSSDSDSSEEEARQRTGIRGGSGGGGIAGIGSSVLGRLESKFAPRDDTQQRSGRRGGGIRGGGGAAGLAGGVGGILGKLESRLTSKFEKIESKVGGRLEKRDDRKAQRAERKAQKNENYRLVVVPA